MPRQARLDAPGTLHHVIVSGIEKRRIVDDKKHRENSNFTRIRAAAGGANGLFSRSDQLSAASALLGQLCIL